MYQNCDTRWDGKKVEFAFDVEEERVNATFELVATSQLQREKFHNSNLPVKWVSFTLTYIQLNIYFARILNYILKNIDNEFVFM